MTTYSCRAELRVDIEQFLAHAEVFGPSIRPLGHFGDATVEFQSDEDLEALKALMSLVPDSHVMQQTLRACALADNSLKRSSAEFAS
jgi:hypothetical protein